MKKNKFDEYLSEVGEKLKVEKSEWVKRTKDGVDYIDFFFYIKGKKYGGSVKEENFDYNREQMKEECIRILSKI